MKSSPSFHFRVRVHVFELGSFWNTVPAEMLKQQCGREQFSFSHICFVFFLSSFQSHALYVLGVLSLVLLLLGPNSKAKDIKF